MRLLSVLLLVVLMIAAFGSTRVGADDPVSSSVSFNREIIRIIQRKCEPCHTGGGLAFSLSDYRDARAWGRAIREELVEHRMPPPVAARGYGGYLSDPSLNTREMATFLTWLDGGMPRGDEVDRPKTTDADAAGDVGSPSLRLSLPAQTVPAGGNLILRRVTVDAASIANRSIARIELRPGNRRILRGAIIFASNPSSASGVSSWVGAWLPWQHAVAPPPTHAFRLESGTNLRVDLYYKGADTEITDRSEVDVVFARDTAHGTISDVTVETAADRSPGQMRGAIKLPQAATIWAVHPEFDASVTAMELRAERPDKSVEVLLWMPTPNPDWPVALVMQEPLSLPAGSTISLIAERKNQTGTNSVPRMTLSVLSRMR
ncbi:MAG TPA: hypothetical protein VFU28_22465 [Vicinamibacterales bacterium]|nr:hypothetical protein [Vicinamibacterales bacterium]